ncbi:sensor domain-containing protein [Mycobacterium spongiae]|uniref:Sensor domain-containing protein n=1 Tax=Mycobacterium spongiae TaxID=886343 RepID=A0A975JYV4_9MYCO|nr:sensor domain-containing protein [Mycobacterium spongiae]QUR68237.1 sensor domain-containing protein [Mycobacterium spongiae]
MRATWSAMVTVLVAALATGCTAVITGTAYPAPGMKPRPLAGSIIKEVLLDGTALSRMLDQPFAADPELPPRFGGSDELSGAYVLSSPVECVGVVAMLQRAAYQSANVTHVARESWWDDGDSGKVISVDEAVVALPTAAEADALFTKFSQQWDTCDGTVLTLRSARLSFRDQIEDVRVANSVLAATVSEESTSGSHSGTIPEARAIGVRVNCLVEVEVAFYSAHSQSDQGSGEVSTSAIDIARTMMEKISALS